MGVLEAARQWSLQLPSNVVRLYRTMLIADMVMLRLDPAIDWRRVLQSFMEEEVARTSIQSAQRFLSPARLLLALGLWIQTPLVVSRLLALADRKLPEAARVYRREGSRLQRFAVGLLEDLRDLALLTVAFVAVNVLTGGAVAAFLEARLGTVWMRVGGLGLMAALLFARAARRAR
jgi:hypothetical protein